MRLLRYLPRIITVLAIRSQRNESHRLLTAFKTLLCRCLISVLFSLPTIVTSSEFDPIDTADRQIDFHAVFHDLPPASYSENDLVVGIDHDIINSITKEIGVSLTAQLAPNRRRLALITSGKTDLIVVGMPVDNTALYSENMQLDKQPLYQIEVRAITLKSQNHLIISRVDLENLRIGHLRIPKDFEDALLPNHPNRTRFNTVTALLKGLLTDRIDVAIAPPPEIFFQAKILGVENRLQVNYKISDVAVFTAWSNKGISTTQEIIRKKFTTAVEKIKREGKISSIIKKYSQLKYFSHYDNEPSENSQNQ